MIMTIYLYLAGVLAVLSLRDEYPEGPEEWLVILGWPVIGPIMFIVNHLER
jgi:hypothetical protein